VELALLVFSLELYVTLVQSSLYHLLTGGSQIMCIIHSVPLQKRPQIQGLFGALFGIASIVGPLIGGAFASNVTWRWCFYVNLPIGGAAMVFIAFCLKIPKQDTARVLWMEKLRQLDFFGTTLLVSGVVCLVLALQWGGQSYAVSYVHSYFRRQLTVSSGAMAASWLVWFS
jgi:MFS family permease